MAMQTTFEGEITAALFGAINARLTAEAEPLIKEAVAMYETRLRQLLATTCVSLIEQSYNLERYGRDLRITVRMPEKERAQRPGTQPGTTPE